MSTLGEDVETYLDELGRAVTNQEALTAVGALAKLSGELGGLLLVGSAATMAISWVTAVLPPLGLGFFVGGLRVAITKLAMMYPQMRTEERQAVRTLIAWAHGVPRLRGTVDRLLA